MNEEENLIKQTLEQLASIKEESQHIEKLETKKINKTVKEEAFEYKEDPFKNVSLTYGHILLAVFLFGCLCIILWQIIKIPVPVNPSKLPDTVNLKSTIPIPDVSPTKTDKQKELEYMALRNAGRYDPFRPTVSESESPIVTIETPLIVPNIKIFTPRPKISLKPTATPTPKKTIKLLGVIKGTKDMALIEVDNGKEKQTYKVQEGEKIDNYTINKIELDKVTLDKNNKAIETGKETEIK